LKKSGLLTAIKYLLFLLLAGLLLYLAFKGQDLQKLLQSLQHVRYGWVSASVLACLIAHYLRAVRWTLLMGSLGHRVPVKNSFYAIMVGYLANLAFPRMGEVTRCGVIHKTDKVSVNELLGTVITERFFDLSFLLGITGTAILLEFDRISAFIYQNGWLKVKALLGSSLLLWLLGLTVVGILGGYVFRKKINKGLKPFEKALQGFKNGILSFKRMDAKGRFFLFSALIWLFYLLSTWLCFYALDATASLGLLAGLSALVFGSLGMIVPVQGGIGAFHWMVAEGLTLYAVEKAEGLAYATLIHSSQILVILIIGGWSLLMVLVNKKASV
jgi:uncharacterized protein (TIRG00374 family)